MPDPLSAWARLPGAASSVAATGRHISATLLASQEVIARRAAMRLSPRAADEVELGRMIPEKIDACSRAAVAVAAGWSTMQADCLAEVRHVAALAAGACAPGVAEWSARASRSAAHAVRLAGNGAACGAAAVVPVHRSATHNARRIRTTAEAA